MEYLNPAADPKALEMGRAEGNISFPSYFIANAHSEPYALCRPSGKGDLLEKNSKANGGGRPHRPKWSFCKRGTMGTLANQAESGVWVKTPGTLLWGSGGYHLMEKIEIVYEKNSAI